MSTVILKIEDNAEGGVDVKTDFYPELNTEDAPTSAQYLALIAIKAMSEEAKQ